MPLCPASPGKQFDFRQTGSDQNLRSCSRECRLAVISTCSEGFSRVTLAASSLHSPSPLREKFMEQKQFIRLAAKVFAAGFGIGVASYAVYAGTTWRRYGRPGKAGGDSDQLLDLFMPSYEVVDRHKVRVNAPAEVALSAAAGMDLQSCAVIRGIFKAREWILRSRP